MRILILSNSDYGLYKFRKELIEKLCKMGELIVAIPVGEYSDKIVSLGSKIVPFDFNRRGKNPIKEIRLFFRYNNLIKRIKPDLVLTYTIKPNLFGGICCRFAKIPYITNITGLGTSIENGGIISSICLNLYRIGLKRANCVFFQNRANLDLFLNKKIVKENYRLIPGSGVNLNDFKLEPYPDDKDGVKFLFVGRIMKDKGIEELLAAFCSLQKLYKNCSLDIVGHCDENYSTVLQNYESKGLIVYHGTQAVMQPFYSMCHCVVLPSYHEGMANVLLEASAMGRPVISTFVAGCKETFEEGISGFGCESGSIESLLLAMKRFVSLSNERREKMGLNARLKMEKEFNRDLVISAYNEEIQTCINAV